MRVVQLVENSFTASQIRDYRPREIGAAGWILVPMSYSTHILQVHFLSADLLQDRQVLQAFWGADQDLRPMQGPCPTDRFRVRHLTGAIGSETLMFVDEPLPYQWFVPVEASSSAIAIGGTVTIHNTPATGLHDFWLVYVTGDTAFTVLVAQAVGGVALGDSPVANWAGPGAGGVSPQAVPNAGATVIKVRNDDGGAVCNIKAHVMGVKGSEHLGL